MSDRTGGGAPGERGPEGQGGAPRQATDALPSGVAPGDPAPAVEPGAEGGAPGVDLGRRRFFRSFGREALQAAAQIVGAATALQRGSLAATNQLFGTGGTETADPLAQLLGIDAPATEPGTPFRSPYRYREGEVTLVDQRRLPDELVEITCRTGAEVAGCIRDRVVRGGPVLGQVAAYGVLLAAERTRGSDQFIRGATLHGTINALRSARPASRVMEVALDRMLAAWQEIGERAAGDLVANTLRAQAEAIADEAMLAHAAIGRAGAAVLPTPFERHLEVLVHGPVGPLAGGILGTGVAVLHALQVESRPVHVWVTEGRPTFHGSRITAFELARLDIGHTVIADAAAASLIARGRVDAVLVGAERIARNGDISAAVGTYPIAAVAARHSVPVYVTAPLATVDPNVADAWEFAAEEGPADELADVNGRRIPPGETLVHNPTLDTTPAALVRGFVTEAGLVEPPFERTLGEALARSRVPDKADPPAAPDAAVRDESAADAAVTSPGPGRTATGSAATADAATDSGAGTVSR